ncbi:MAG: FAD-binding oxidoreductase [Candidatus Wukongarchaeota archaeon]|nr:FAD-binding oxidoreductase [Candidatus Wukongarchaeota archaeon]
MDFIRTGYSPGVTFEKVRKIEGKENIESMFSSYTIDESKLKGYAEWLFFPKNEEEIVTVVQEMEKRGVPITISAARTGIVGGCVPFGGAILSLEKLNAILGLGFDEKTKQWYVRSQPGVSLKELNEKVIQKKFPELEEKQKELLDKFSQDEKTYWYPVDPTEKTAHLGGTVATNASGSLSYKYGATRKWVRKVRLVLANGEILDIPRGKYHASPEGTFTIQNTAGETKTFSIPYYRIGTNVKNAAGLFTEPSMDLIDLFIGSEGILGVITEVEVWITEKPENVIAVTTFFPTEMDAASFVNDIRLKDSSLKTEFLEYLCPDSLKLLRKKQISDPPLVNMPPIPENVAAIIFEISYNEDSLPELYERLETIAIKNNSSMDQTWACYEDREIDRITAFRHLLPETVNAIIAERKQKNPTIHKLGTDMAVPIIPETNLAGILSFYREKLRESNLEHVIFGHIGDNHLHINILPKDEKELAKAKELYKVFAKKAVSLGGTVSAEHGIGKIKKEYFNIMFDEDKRRQIIEVKQALDPTGLFSIGNMVNI